MIKKVLPTLILSACIQAASAQVSIGPRIGVTNSTVDFRAYINHRFHSGPTSSVYRKGLLLGVVSNVKIKDWLSIQPELNFTQKGTRYDYFGPLSQRADYMELPLLGKASLGFRNVRFFVTAGPTVAYLMRLKIEGEMSGEKYKYEADLDDSYTNRWDIGASLGGGAAFKVGVHELNIDVRYGIEFTDKLESPVSAELRTKNRSYSLSLAYLFSKG